MQCRGVRAIGWFLVAACVLAASGCGGGGSGASGSAGQGAGGVSTSQVADGTGVVRINFPQGSSARSRTGADLGSGTLSFTGYGALGQVLYGPVARPIASVVTLVGVPLPVVHLRIALRAPQGGTVAALVTVPLSLQVGESTTVDDPWGTGAQLASLALDPASGARIPAGTLVRCTATGTFTDGSFADVTDLATWSSGSSSTATVNDVGKVMGVAGGRTVISASSVGISGSVPITVTTASLRAVVITPSSVSIPTGATVSMRAMGTYDDGSSVDITEVSTWWTPSPQVLSMGAEGVQAGRITGLSQGSTVVAARKDGVTGTASVAVTSAVLQSVQVIPSSSSVPVAQDQQFTARAVFSDGSTVDVTRDVTWNSSDALVAVLSSVQPGYATAARAGTAAITATYQGLQGSGTLLVTGASLVSISVSPRVASISVGGRQQFTATGTYSDGSSQELTDAVTWASSASTVATIVAHGPGCGAVSGASAGEASITATLGCVQGTAALTVASSSLNVIAVGPSAPVTNTSIPVQLRATGQYTDGHTEDLTSQVTWASSSAGVAGVASTGLVTPVSVGTATVTATWQGITGRQVLTVGSAVLQSLEIVPTASNDPSDATLWLPMGQQGQFFAIGHLGDGSRVNLTSLATWSSSPGASIASMGETRPGLCTAGSSATAGVQVTAEYSGFNAVATLNVASRRLVSIAVIGPGNKVAANGTLQYRAVGYYDDNTTTDLSSQVTWNLYSTYSPTSKPAPPPQLSIDGTGLVTAVAAPADTCAVVSASLGAVHGEITLQANPTEPGGETYLSITVVNNSGYPDEAVYLTSYGNDSGGLFYYNTFTANPVARAYDAAGLGFQYSFPLASLVKAGANTYTFQCPTSTWTNQDHFQVSLGRGLAVGRNGGGFVQPGFGPQMATPFELIQELSFTSGAFGDMSCVDNFSLGSSVTVTGTTTAQTGFLVGARNPVLENFMLDPVFNVSAVRHNFTTTQVLSPNQLCSGGFNSVNGALKSYLAGAIASGWAKYGGLSNPNIPATGWVYGGHVWKPSATAAPDVPPGQEGSYINLKAFENGTSEGVVSVPIPSTASVFANVLSATAQSASGAAVNNLLQNALPAALLRGVFEDYPNWGVSTGTGRQSGKPDQYYASGAFSKYALFLHAYANNQLAGVANSGLVYAFPADNQYCQSGDTGTFTITGASMTFHIPPFDRTR